MSCSRQFRGILSCISNLSGPCHITPFTKAQIERYLPSRLQNDEKLKKNVLQASLAPATLLKDDEIRHSVKAFEGLNALGDLIQTLMLLVMATKALPNLLKKNSAGNDGGKVLRYQLYQEFD